MATEKNITMKQFNGTDYDTLYPKTLASQIPDVYSKSQTYPQSQLYTRSQLYTQSQIDSMINSINTALDGKARIQTGSYVGTGTYGESNPCSLTFDFEPSVIMISGKGGFTGYEAQNTIVAVNKSPLSTIIHGQYPFSVNVNFNGNQVSWYTTADNPGYQANDTNYTYSYAAIG